MTPDGAAGVLAGFFSRWCGTATPRLAVALAGVGVIVALCVLAWDRRLRWPAALLGGLGGALLVVVALDPRVAEVLAGTAYLTRIRWTMALLSALVVGITIESIRRSRLQERYALLWIATGLTILLCAIFPRGLAMIGSLLGTQYATSVVGLVFTFLVLVAFHFSIAMSGFQDNQRRLAQRCALLEAEVERLRADVDRLKARAGPAAPEPAAAPAPEPAAWTAPDAAAPPPAAPAGRGSAIAAWALAAVAVLGVLATGLLAPQAMVGDEVTHYYMVTEQAVRLPAPSFASPIPTAAGWTAQRHYPHAFFWHYAAAAVFRWTGGSFAALQAYHALFFAQLLVFAFLLARARNGPASRAPLLYVVTLASLPLALIFGVTFYQDVPLAAQAVASFYFLRRGRWGPAALFMALALGIKETAVLFLPAWFVLLALERRCAGGWRRAAVPVLASAALFAAVAGVTEVALRRELGVDYYPVGVAKRLWNAWRDPSAGGAAAPDAASDLRITADEALVSANHPGDLRIAENWIVYGGALAWIVAALGLAGAALRRRPGPDAADPRPESPAWLFAVGGSFAALTAWLLRSAPDARFFLPAVPFLILPAAESAARLPRARVLLAALAALGILQAGYVLAKTRDLRRVPPGLTETARFLAEHRPDPPMVFMYPEGNFRLFPVAHDWYLDYRLREFWRADNDERLRMLRARGIGAIVVKKARVAPVDERIANLGVYPVAFVRDLERDPRFAKVFENGYAAVYAVPAAP